MMPPVLRAYIEMIRCYAYAIVLFRRRACFFFAAHGATRHDRRHMIFCHALRQRHAQYGAPLVARGALMLCRYFFAMPPPTLTLD